MYGVTGAETCFVHSTFSCRAVNFSFRSLSVNGDLDNQLLALFFFHKNEYNR